MSRWAGWTGIGGMLMCVGSAWGVASEFASEEVITLRPGTGLPAITQMMVRDLNGDGLQDLLTNTGTQLDWYANNGDSPATWKRRVIQQGTSTVFFDAGDMNDDGDLDLVVYSRTTTSPIVLFENQGQSLPTFVQRTIVNGRPTMIRLADLDEDGDVDIAGIRTTALTRYFNNGSATPEFTLTSQTLTSSYVDMRVAELDGSPGIDILLASSNSSRLDYLARVESEASSYELRVFSASGGNDSQIDVGDFNGDGDIDAISGVNAAFKWYENIPEGPLWVRRPIATTPLASNRIEVQDLNGDLRPDLFSSVNNGFAGWYENDGEFVPSFFEHELASNSNVVAFGDLDTDGDLDYVFWQSSKIHWQENLSRLRLESAEFSDQNGNGVIGQGEDGTLRIVVRNQQSQPRLGATIEVTSLTPGLSFPVPRIEIPPPGPNAGPVLNIPFWTDAFIPCASILQAEVTLSHDGTEELVRTEHAIVGVHQSDLASFEVTSGSPIPDNDPEGLISTVSPAVGGGLIESARVFVDITHEYRGDVAVTISGPEGVEFPVFEGQPIDFGRDVSGEFEVAELIGTPAAGDYSLRVVDRAPGDVGTLNHWRLELEWGEPACETSPAELVVEALLGERATTPEMDANGDGFFTISDALLIPGE